MQYFLCGDRNARARSKDSRRARFAKRLADEFGVRRDVLEEKDPDTRAGPGGERLLISAGSSASLSASMEVARNVATPQFGGETIPGLGDQAFFTSMHKMLFVRKGTSYLLIQPQFVKDPRGVAIAAAGKILESPSFGR